MLSKPDLAILGAGGTGRYMRDVALRTGSYREVFYLDDDTEKQSSGVDGAPTMGPLEHWQELPPDTQFLSSLYAPAANQAHWRRVTSLKIPDDRWTSVLDPTAVISKNSTIGVGCFIGSHTTIEPGVSLANHCAIAQNVTIAHDTKISSYSYCAFQVAIGSRVSVGEYTFVGIGARIRGDLEIGRNSLIGVGATVISAVPPSAVVVGNPARPLEKSIKGLRR
ncbi:NeuD/PglB/VioB family sugar acetyltransferase [Gephyromycinifex aptenodytis]|uniref:NeuD/PglB/VioB family sugar acetyltransferase n=1 Tax=Gephyromycinifex aptenodytis TaxID=2716227 RepID=UPI0014486A5F|nr:NeuD/PglB/VioB family sugar acetyltransferase [Gephyromycinifex aptenodytis]